MSFAREQLAALLAGGAAREAFSASMSAPASDLQLEVRGVGPIGLPVSQAQARQLCGVARPASYGRGAETLLDRGVRDTWVVPKSRVKIDGRRWNKALRPALDRLGRDLGLPAGSELRAEFHSMLVYARGQFFVSHQDSEKDDAMIASLVVGLPSSFEGGALVVRHGGETLIYRGSKEKLSLLAFYSDCRHEVEPVTSGYRVVLTYNLLLRRGADASSADLDPALVDGVARCLEEHFASSDRLVYLLDHEYTRRGLGRARLKGADARRASLLAAAAERARCEHTLALADVHETWSAYEPDDRYRRWRDWEDVGLDDGGDYELEEMIESEVALESWIAASGAIEEVALFVSDAELCATTPSGELEPYASEYEGYMGNWGNTLDRWYHRGAIVVWPRSRAFVVRAEASPGWALDELAARAERGDLASARTAVQSLAPLWGRVAARAQTTGLLASTLRVAQVIGEPQSATLLLQPFRLQTVGASHAAELSGLAAGYGEEWAAGLVTLWSSSLAARPYVADEDTLAWIASLPRLCLALRGAGGAGVTTAGLLIDAAWRWLSEAIDRDRRLPSPSRREQALQALGAPLVAIVQSAATVDRVGVRDAAVALLCGDEELLGCALAVLRALPRSQWVEVDAVAARCRTVLAGRLARPERAPADWSIELPAGCDCGLCTALGEFLRAPDRRTHEWRLAKDGRRHVHQRVDAAELPVRHQTRRVGRPYTLVLTKTDALFEREAQQRRTEQQELVWLAM